MSEGTGWPGPGVEVSLPGGGVVRLSAPVHSEARSRRWRGRDEASGVGYEVLFLAPGEDPGPLLSPEVDEGICGWDHVRVEREGQVALAFREDQLRPLAEVLPWPELEEEAAREAERERRLETVLALGELFEMLHLIGEALVVHGALEAFALRADAPRPQVVMRWPELLHPMSSPPAPGSYQGWGLDAPEVTGLVVRPVDARADVYMLGVLTWALLTGVRPEAGMERHTEALPLLRAFDAGIPLGVDACVRRAMARVPEERPATVTAFLDELRRAWAWGRGRALTGPDRRVHVGIGARTVIGRGKRLSHRVNQDSHLALFDPEGGWGLFAVMDGVSRCDLGSGELASWLARTTLEAEWHRKMDTPIFGRRFEGASPFPANLLGAMARRAHGRVSEWSRGLLEAEAAGVYLDADPTAQATAQAAAQLAALRGAPRRRSVMGTTMTALGLFGDRAEVMAVGDSPAWLVRLDGADQEGPFIERLTVAQTSALASMRGGVGPVEALEAPGAKWLEMAIGRSRQRPDGKGMAPVALRPEGCQLRLQPGDLVLVTSDGVPDALGPGAEREIVSILAQTLGPGWPGVARAEAELIAGAAALVREADARGGRDNITAVLVAIGPVEPDRDSQGEG